MCFARTRRCCVEQQGRRGARERLDGDVLPRRGLVRQGRPLAGSVAEGEDAFFEYREGFFRGLNYVRCFMASSSSSSRSSLEESAEGEGRVCVSNGFVLFQKGWSLPVL